MDAFDVISEESIHSGRATDAYFQRTVETLEHAGRNPEVVAEVSADQFATGEFEVLAGVKDAAHLLARRDVDGDGDGDTIVDGDGDTIVDGDGDGNGDGDGDGDGDIDVHALPEGTLFDGGPVMRLTGPYLEFARYETSLLGFLSHASGIATAAMRARRAAPDSSVLSFGARHLHPANAAMLERSALVGGLDGFSHVAAGDVIGREAGGTMPHALVICFGKGNQEDAWRAFDEAVAPDVPRVALCDTYSDEVDEALRAAELGFDSVRLDTTASRRGDFRQICREVRWELDVRGHDDVGLFASGGLGPAELRDLRDVAEGFGVGGYVSNADPVDFALDIVEVEGEHAAKRGKLSGAKQVYRTPAGGHHVALAGAAHPADGEPLLEPMVEDGEIVRSFDLDDAVERCREDADRVLSNVT